MFHYILVNKSYVLVSAEAAGVMSILVKERTSHMTTGFRSTVLNSCVCALTCTHMLKRAKGAWLACACVCVSRLLIVCVFLVHCDVNMYA